MTTGPDVIDHPNTAVFCFSCGASLHDFDLYTCTINGHLGTVICCPECLKERMEIKKEIENGK